MPVSRGRLPSQKLTVDRHWAGLCYTQRPPSHSAKPPLWSALFLPCAHALLFAFGGAVRAAVGRRGTGTVVTDVLENTSDAVLNARVSRTVTLAKVDSLPCAHALLFAFRRRCLRHSPGFRAPGACRRNTHAGSRSGHSAKTCAKPEITRGVSCRLWSNYCMSGT